MAYNNYDQSITITCYNDKANIRGYDYLRKTNQEQLHVIMIERLSEGYEYLGSSYCKQPESMNGSFRFALKGK